MTLPTYVITYVDDLAALEAWLIANTSNYIYILSTEENGLFGKDPNKAIIAFDHNYPAWSEDETKSLCVSYLRDVDALSLVEDCPNMEILGTGTAESTSAAFTEIQADPAALAKYSLVWTVEQQQDYGFAFTEIMSA